MTNRVVFFGTPKIAVSCLQALLDAKVEVAAVVTKPDMPIGRKQIIEESDVKIFAKKHNILVLQPVKIDDIYDELVKLQATLFVVCAYGKLISERILHIPKFHCVNVHTSLLPRWRGGAPIHYAVLSGDKQTGISLIYMTKELDAGDVIYQQAMPIDLKETYRTLYDKLSHLAYVILKNKIYDLFEPNVPCVPQKQKGITIARNISRADEKIKWNSSHTQIEQQVRGLFDKPIAYAIYKDMNIKIYETEQIDNVTKIMPGSIVQISREGIDVACGNHKILRIIKLQLPGKKPFVVREMINGNHPFELNTQFA